MLQRVLAEPAWMARMMPADLRAFAARLGPRQPLRRLRPRYEATARPGYPCRGLRPEDSLQKAHFVESMLSCLSGQQGVAAMPMEPPEGRKVKSGPVGGSKGSGDTEGIASRAK